MSRLRYLRAALRLAWHFLLFMCGACGATSPLGLHYGCNSDVPTCNVAASQLDALARVSARITGLPASEFGKRWVEVIYSAKPIEELGGQLDAGCTTETNIQVLYTGDLYAPRDATLHELYHEALWLKTGDYDSTHSAPTWRELDSYKAELRGER